VNHCEDEIGHKIWEKTAFHGGQVPGSHV